MSFPCSMAVAGSSREEGQLPARSGIQWKGYIYIKAIESSYLRCLWKHAGIVDEGGNGFHNFGCKLARIVPQLDHDIWDPNKTFKN